MALNIWPTMKRLLFLERERMENLGQIASQLDYIETLEHAVMRARAERDYLAHELRQLATHIEIENLCAEVEGEA